MKYRVKIITYGNGRQAFYAQVKWLCFWKYIWHEGDERFEEGCCQTSIDSSLERIDKHINGNTKIKSIEFEYINKQK